MSVGLPVRSVVVAGMVAGGLGWPAVLTVSAAHAGSRVPCTATATTTRSGPADLLGKVPPGTTGGPDTTCGEAAQTTTADQMLPAPQADVRGFEAKAMGGRGPFCAMFSAGAEEVKAGLAVLGLTNDAKALPKQPQTEQEALPKQPRKQDRFYKVLKFVQVVHWIHDLGR
ncbi:hypothetical protein OG589_09290 [Sphaerisporangium sp. NBC_01403]|uniref:hypothetical protein n=1 Tax=Sphaerisporangium sp. NBC_01403 TaxID=2903599 RepID=UPI00324D59DE